MAHAQLDELGCLCRSTAGSSAQAGAFSHNIDYANRVSGANCFLGPAFRGRTDAWMDRSAHFTARWIR